LLLLRARTEFERENFASAKRSLDRFDQIASTWSYEPRRAWLERDLLLAEILLERGDKKQAQLALDGARSRLTAYLGDIDSGVEGYLWLSGIAAAKRILRELTTDEPLASLGVELYRRDLYRRISAAGRAREESQSAPVTIERFRRIGESARSLAASQGATLCVYAIHEREVRRWTCDATGVRLDLLDVAVDRLGQRIREVWKAMAADPVNPTAPPPPETVAALRELADVLLPDGINDRGTADAPFYVSADGFLRQIPFEALHLSRGDLYDPLLRHRDVVYIRHVDAFAARPSPTAKGLIVVNTSQPASIRGTISERREVAEALSEGESVAARFPNSVFLRAESATKANLTRLWENSSFVYVASHILSDPDVPYLSLLPLADDKLQAGPDAALLDVGDILSADLRGCAVVVLSGCSSGVPYVGRRSSAPSLGDAFLDAGAQTVVQTFWDVRDDRARHLMEIFLRRWDGSSAGAVRAMCDARREAMEGPDGVRHPFSWAAYSVQINGRP